MCSPCPGEAQFPKAAFRCTQQYEGATERPASLLMGCPCRNPGMARPGLLSRAALLVQGRAAKVQGQFCTWGWLHRAGMQEDVGVCESQCQDEHPSRPPSSSSPITRDLCLFQSRGCSLKNTPKTNLTLSKTDASEQKVLIELIQP